MEVKRQATALLTLFKEQMGKVEESKAERRGGIDREPPLPIREVGGGSQGGEKMAFLTQQGPQQLPLSVPFHLPAMCPSSGIRVERPITQGHESDPMQFTSSASGREEVREDNAFRSKKSRSGGGGGDGGGEESDVDLLQGDQMQIS